MDTHNTIITSKRVYTLYRVSTLGQVEKDDIPMQKQRCREFVAEHGWHIEKEFSEKGVSGFKTSAKDRDAIQEIQRDAAAGKFDILLVFMFDRLGRRDDETPFVVEWFVKNGIEVWSTVEGQQRFDSHVDKLMNYIRYWQASGESIKTSIRTKTRIAQLTESGLYTGGSVPYGYKLVKQGRINKRNREVFDLAIDEDEAAIIRLIFQKYVHEGFGTQRLCRYLHENGYTRSDGRGFPNTTINRILKNPLYIGVLKNGDTCSPCIEELQIIDKNTFDQAQFIMKERTQPHSTVPLNCKSAALLVGRVYCAHCGNRLTLSTSGHKKRMEDGTTANIVRSRYQCHYQVRHPGLCDGQSVYSVEKLDSLVDQIVRRTLSRFAAIPEVELIGAQQKTELQLQQAKQASTEAAIRDAKNELEDYRSEAIRVIRGQSSLSTDLLNSLIAETEQRLHSLERTLATGTAAMQNLTDAAQRIRSEYNRLIDWAELYDSCSKDARKMIIGQLVKAIYVSRGYKVRIEFNISFESFHSYAPQPAKLRQKNEPMSVLTSTL